MKELKTLGTTFVLSQSPKAEAFKDDMLKLLVVCAIIALTFDLAVATPEERHTCKSISSHSVLLIEFSNESFSVDQRLRHRYCSTSCSLSWFFRRLEKGNSVYEKPCKDKPQERCKETLTHIIFRAAFLGMGYSKLFTTMICTSVM